MQELPPGFVWEQPQAGPAVVPITGPRAPTPVRPVEQDLDEARLEALRNPVPAGYRRIASGNLEYIPGGPADPANRTRSTRQLPQQAIEHLTTATTGVTNLDRAINTFQDDYAGNTITGGLENSIQGRISGFGTPGQNQWWSDVAATDNVLRNALFGASLTQGEKDAWQATTVNPGMAPDLVRDNLRRRREVAVSILRRRARTYRANGFNEDAIRESLGELSSLVDDEAGQAAAARTDVNGSAVSSQPEGTHIQFGLDPNPAAPRAQMAGSEQFRAQLAAAINGGQLRTSEDVLNAARNIDPELAARLNPRDVSSSLRQFLIARRRDPRARMEIDPIFEVGPDISGQRGANADQNRLIMENTLAASGGPLAPVSQAANALLRPEGASALNRGLSDLPFLGMSEEVRSGIDTLGGGTLADNYRRQEAISEYDNQNNFGARLTGQAIGGLALPFGEASTPLQLARVGARYGAAYEFGSTRGGIGDRLVGAAEGALTGGATAGTLGAVARGISRLGSGSPNAGRAAAQDLIAAADRQNVPVIPADVGGPMVRRMTGSLGQSVVGGAPIINAAEQTGAKFAGRVGDIATSEGAPVRQEVLGETLEGAFDRFNTGSAAEGRRAYEGARQLAGDREFIGLEAVRNLDQHIDELGQNASTNAPLIAGLERLRSDLAQPEIGLRLKSIDAMRQLRTSTRAEAQTEGLRGTDYQRRAREVLDGLSNDISADLPANAAAEFRRADRQWAERLDFIDDVETRLLGPRGDRSAEKITRSLMDMTRGDSSRFGRILDQVTPEEAGIIRGSVINEMGRPAPGSPESFSVETWARNYRALPERTRDMLFRGGNRAHANDLLTIAEGVERAGKYRNFSNSGGAISFLNIMRTLGAGGGGAAGGIPGAVAGAAGVAGAEAALGRLLASPRFARWLARPPQDRGRALRRLSQIAAREPQIAQDIIPIREALETGVRSAAADQEQDRR